MSTDDRLDPDPTLRPVAAPHTHGSTSTPAYRSGPNVAALLLGILGLVVATLVLISQLGGVDLTRSPAVPIVVLSAGGLCVAVGIIGLIRTALRRRGGRDA